MVETLLFVVVAKSFLGLMMGRLDAVFRLCLVLWQHRKEANGRNHGKGSYQSQLLTTRFFWSWINSHSAPPHDTTTAHRRSQ
jgi:hypothetical protein